MPAGFHLPEQVATLATVGEVERVDDAVGGAGVRLEGAQRVELGLPVFSFNVHNVTSQYGDQKDFMQIFSQIIVTSPYRRGIPFGNRGIKVKHCKWFTFTQQFIQRPITLNDSMELRTTMAWLRFLSHRMNSASECIYIRENRDHAHMTYMGSLQYVNLI